MLSIYLFALCFGLFSVLTYNPNSYVVNQSKKLPQQQLNNIATATPGSQIDNQSIVTAEVNLSNGNHYQSTNYQELSLVGSPSFVGKNGKKIHINEYTENSSRILAAPAQMVCSVPLASESKPLSTSIVTSLATEETVENLQLETDIKTVEKQLMYDKKIIDKAVCESQLAIVEKIQGFIETKTQMFGSYQPLYDMLVDYPFRNGKMLRPTMCISVARAVGGMGHDALISATALELYHNAFLIHDDIQDGSEARRGKETLHQLIGIPRAINVGDATNVLAVGLLLENLSVVGVGKALNILHEIEFMAQQSVEGQAMELDWVAKNSSNLTDQDYFKMCVKKTCWYTFMSPCRIGLILGYPSANTKDLVEPLAGLTRFGMLLGIAFQIQDDLLNLQGELKNYGKEIGGDIYEGKRTLMLNHVLAHSQKSDKILEILALPREQKTPQQLNFVLEQMLHCGSIEHGWKIAHSFANQAAELFESLDFIQSETPLRSEERWKCPLHDRRFLKELINYVIYRNK
ncbi:polyprenyl synthetase family protein [Cylindrospermum sp. NIES-4074]|nr:polyprenyl synthetase family protein [Cylindrospermum sp. NIES-4074]